VLVSEPDNNVGQLILDFIKYFSPEGVKLVKSYSTDSTIC
jgi:hypothetical protein